MIESSTYGVKNPLSSACHYVASHHCPVVEAIEQRHNQKRTLSQNAQHPMTESHHTL